jgi:hypothetical protein
LNNPSERTSTSKQQAEPGFQARIWYYFLKVCWYMNLFIYNLYNEKWYTYKILGGKPEGKRPIGISRRRWEGNIKMDVRGIEWDNMDWINLT